MTTWAQAIPPRARELFEQLDQVVLDARAALAAGDMQAWADHAARGALLHEELAVVFGWRQP